MFQSARIRGRDVRPISLHPTTTCFNPRAPRGALGSYTTKTEWFATFYRPDRARPATDLPNGFIALPVERNSSFKRVPYATGFRTLAGNFDFVLISVHLEPEDKVYRAQEFEAIDEWLQRQLGAQSERDLIVLGDCNVQNKTELSSVTPGGFISLNVIASARTSLLDQRSRTITCFSILSTPQRWTAHMVFR